MNKKCSIVLLTILLLGGCTWVNLTPAGSGVNVLPLSAAGNCERIGTATANVVDKIWFIQRNRAKIAEELKYTAQNQAAKMGGNSIVATSEISEGYQEFDVYKCP